MAPPSITNNLLHDVLEVNLQVMLRKAVKNHGQLVESKDTTKFGWEMKISIPVPVTM